MARIADRPDMTSAVYCGCKKKKKNQRQTKNYGNDPKFSDRQVWANSAYPDQTAPRGAV